MKLPEFTAEASLYRAHERYHENADLQSKSGAVLPQAESWGCYLECIAWGNDPRDCARGCGFGRYVR